MERIGGGHGSSLIDQSQNWTRFALLNTIASLRHAAPARATDSRLHDRENVARLSISLVRERAHDRVTFVTRLIAVSFVVLTRESWHIGHSEHTGRCRYQVVDVRIVATVVRSEATVI